MLESLRQWRHVFKLDPDRRIADDALEALCLSGTDAVCIGGSSGVTFENTVELLARVRRFAVPCVLEVSSVDAIVPGFDGYLIPVVLNAGSPDWIVGEHRKAVRQWGARIPWNDTVAEGYVVMNPESTVASLTGADMELDAEDVVAYARLCEHLFRFPVFYIEYSGKFGDMRLVGQVKKVLQRTRLFYGGGIDSPEKAALAAEAADTIIVGNVVYEDVDKALQTVRIKK